MIYPLSLIQIMSIVLIILDLACDRSKIGTWSLKIKGKFIFPSQISTIFIFYYYLQSVSSLLRFFLFYHFIYREKSIESYENIKLKLSQLPATGYLIRFIIKFAFFLTHRSSK